MDKNRLLKLPDSLTFWVIRIAMILYLLLS
jgi:hypothetical protein